MSLLTPILPGLGETVVWKSKSSIDQYGDPTFLWSSITVIWFDEKKFVRVDGKDELICDAFCMTDSLVLQEDIIIRDGEDWPVLRVAITPAFGGLSLRVVNMSKNQA